MSADKLFYRQTNKQNMDFIVENILICDNANGLFSCAVLMDKVQFSVPRFALTNSMHVACCLNHNISISEQKHKNTSDNV